MPKIKTNKAAAKKFRVTANGKVKSGHAHTSHNTGKKGPKRRRNLRKRFVIDKTNMDQVRGLLPYINKL